MGICVMRAGCIGCGPFARSGNKRFEDLVLTVWFYISAVGICEIVVSLFSGGTIMRQTKLAKGFAVSSRKSALCDDPGCLY